MVRGPLQYSLYHSTHLPNCLVLALCFFSIPCLCLPLLPKKDLRRIFFTAILPFITIPFIFIVISPLIVSEVTILQDLKFLKMSVGLLFMTKAFQGAQITIVAPLKYLEVVFTMLVGVIWFQDLYNFWSLLGVALILTGLVLNIKTNL